MSAEDLDKLFRDKLANRPVTPSPDAWARLQAQMQPEDEKKERKPFLWIYASAASVALLLGVGIWTMKDGIDFSNSATPLATVQPDAAPANAQAQAETGTTVPVVEATPQVAAVEAEETENNYQSQATVLASNASNHQRPAIKANRDQNMNTSSTANSAPAERIPETTIVLASNSAAVTEEAPLEIIVKLDGQQAQTTLAQANTDEEPEQEDRKARRIVKGLFKQVKNLREGERVDLSELGITKHTFALETRIGNKKITKTINL